MFPLRDNTPNVHKPVMVTTIVVINVALFVFGLLLSPKGQAYVFHVFGLVPLRLTDSMWASANGYPGGVMVSLFSHMFLHSSWMHIIGNMWTLWIFGDNIEDVMGPFRFLIFYLCCGFAALATHLFFNFSSPIPVVGASGAIAGVMGAYLVLYPHAKVATLIPIFIFPWFVDLPAVLFLGIWFLLQFFNGAASAAGGGGVAWWAHVGGFVAGIVLLKLFEDKNRCQECYLSGKSTTPFWQEARRQKRPDDDPWKHLRS
jgi:membrane associated rhomboid family serine protease